MDDKEFMTNIREEGDVDYACKHARVIPLNYVCEMICDWVASGMIHCANKNQLWTPMELWNYWQGHDSKLTIHPLTRRTIECILKGIVDKGTDFITAENLRDCYDRNCNFKERLKLLF
jgi:hypothetical protein